MTVQAKFIQVIERAIELNELNNSYGYLSCVQYPYEYQRMDELNDLMRVEVSKITRDNDVSEKGLLIAIESIATDVYNGNIRKEQRFTLMDQSEFIDYVGSRMTRRERERFTDMLEWMDETLRAEYLKIRFILVWENDRNEKYSFYFDNRFSFVVIVD